MSTNYYFVNKQSKLEVEQFNQKLELIFKDMILKLRELNIKEDELLSFEIERYEMKRRVVKIHIGKRSVGWKPLFEKCEYYSTMQQMLEWYCRNEDHWTIENEYEKEFTWDGMKKELIDWDGGGGHTQCRIYSRYRDVYKCGYGFEWTTREFS